MTDPTGDPVAAVVAQSVLARTPHAIAVRTSQGVALDVVAGRVGSVDLSVDTVMYAASIAKQVVGLLAARQVVSGELDVDAPLTTYLTDLPTWASGVRVRHLLHHTSGLVDEPWLRDAADNAEVVSVLRSDAVPASAPGTAFRYSNLGYVCLAEILTVTGGQTTQAQAGELFDRFAMSSAQLGGVHGAALARMQGQQVPPATIGDGGLWLSVDDLRRWNDAMNAQVLGAQVHQLAETPGTLEDGTPLDYAWGVRVVDHSGHRTVSHGGSWPTWSAKTIRRPDQGASVAVLTTSDDAAGVTALALGLADVAS